MTRKERKGTKLQNPFGMGIAEGGIPQGQFLGIGNPDGAVINFNQDELENELADILGESEPQSAPASTKKGPVPWHELDSMINGCMEEIDDEDEDVDDSDLENELVGMLDDPPIVETTPRVIAVPEQKSTTAGLSNTESILEQRVREYALAVENSTGSKKKRMERQLKSVQQLLKKAQSGAVIKEEDIPSPPAGIGLNKTNTAEPSAEVQPEIVASPVHPEKVYTEIVEPAVLPEVNTKVVAPPIPARTNSNELNVNKHQAKLDLMQKTLTKYKEAALTMKKEGNTTSAVAYFQAMKKIKSAIDEKNYDFEIPKVSNATSTTSAPKIIHVPQQEKVPVPETKNDTMPSPKTPMEALLQRRAAFVTNSEEAKKAGNGSKARRLGRIIKQYDGAIRLLKGGGVPDFASLPDLPSFPPIPGVEKKEMTYEDSLMAATRAEKGEDSDTEDRKPVSGVCRQPVSLPSQVPVDALKPIPVKQPASIATHQVEDMPQLPGAVTAGSDGSSAYSQQLEFLNSRHLQFKQAALKEKAKGNKETAMKYLKSMKGMEPMIENAKMGLPVDIRKIPAPPGFSDNPLVEFRKDQLDRQDSTGTATRVLNDLASQVKKARMLSTQFSQLGNIEKAALMEKWAKQSQRDMDIVNVRMKNRENLPKVTYERRNIQLINKQNDLRNNECEIRVKRVISIPGDPGSLNAFVLVEFPYPREKHSSAKTAHIRGDANPKFGSTMKFEINRNHNTFKRAVKNKSIKFVLCQKGGIFSSDKIIGQANLPLACLESKCEVHRSLVLMDGRRPLEAKVEVVVRLSEPFGATEIVNEDIEWVILETTKGQSVSVNPTNVVSNNMSLKALSIIEYDIKIEDAKIERCKKTRNPAGLESHSKRKKTLMEEYRRTKKFVSASRENRDQYILAIKVQLGDINRETQSYVRSGDRVKAKLCLEKKRLIENELTSFSSGRTSYI